MQELVFLWMLLNNGVSEKQGQTAQYDTNLLDVLFFLNIFLHCVHSEKDLIELSLSLMICQQICSEEPFSGWLYPNHHCTLLYAQPLLYINLEYHLESLSKSFHCCHSCDEKSNRQIALPFSFLLFLSFFFSVSISPVIFPFLTTPYFRHVYLHVYENAPCSLQIPSLEGDVYSPFYDHVPTDSPIPLLSL